MNSTFSSKSTETKQLARQGIEAVLPPKQTGRPLPLLLSHSYAVGRPKDHPGGGGAGKHGVTSYLSQHYKAEDLTP